MSPDEIRQNPHLGEDSVEPLLLADAAYIDGKGRDNETADIFHFLDTLVRSRYWGSGIPNDSLEQKILIFTHDLPEDKSSTIGGNYGLVRFIGLLFGQKYDAAVGSLTGFRGTICNQIRNELGPAPSPEEIVRLLKLMQNNSGNPQHQQVAFRGMERSFNRYLGEIPKFGWNHHNQEESREMIDRFKKTIAQLVQEPIDPRIIKSLSELFSQSVIDYVNDPKSQERREDCPPTFISSEYNLKYAILMHNLKHLIYNGDKGSYMQDLLKFAIENTTQSGRFSDNLGLVTMLCKLQENGDNIRKPKSLHLKDQHMAYFKTQAVCDTVELYLKSLQRIAPNNSQIGYMGLRELKGELLQTLTEDASKSERSRDTSSNEPADWLNSKFHQVRKYVGSIVETYVVDELVELSYSSLKHIARKAAIKLQDYATLTKDKDLMQRADIVVDRYNKRFNRAQISGALLL